MIDDKITVVIPTSPIKKHPDTAMILTTITLIRQQLPTARILITADGVRPEQEHMRAAYDKYKADLYEWTTKQKNIDIIIFDEFLHQSGMIREALEQIDTELLLFIEHDFPVVGDIPWENIVEILTTNQVDLVRFYWETELIPQHTHMFLDKKAFMIGGVPVIRNGQWSQRPHIARTEYYRQVVEKRLSKTSRTYIEDGVHGWFGAGITERRYAFWGKNRLCIYFPEGNISRCIHLDGREDEPKYEMKNE